MRYWIILVVYIFVAGSYFSYSVQSCSKNENGVVTGGACSIQELKKQEQKKNKAIKNTDKKEIKKIKTKKQSNLNVKK